MFRRARIRDGGGKIFLLTPSRKLYNHISHDLNKIHGHFKGSTGVCVFKKKYVCLVSSRH